MNIQCDRCKSIYDKSGTITLYEEEDRNHLVVSEIRFDGVYLISEDIDEKYLCPKCTKELRDWIGI